MLELKKTESRKVDPSRLSAQRMATRVTTRPSKVWTIQNSVNGAAVLAVGFEPTRAFARRVVTPLRLPVSPRQHPNRRRTEGTHKGMETRRVKLVAEPQH